MLIEREREKVWFLSLCLFVTFFSYNNATLEDKGVIVIDSTMIKQNLLSASAIWECPKTIKRSDWHERKRNKRTSSIKSIKDKNEDFMMKDWGKKWKEKRKEKDYFHS